MRLNFVFLTDKLRFNTDSLLSTHIQIIICSKCIQSLVEYLIFGTFRNRLFHIHLLSLDCWILGLGQDHRFLSRVSVVAWRLLIHHLWIHLKALDRHARTGGLLQRLLRSQPRRRSCQPSSCAIYVNGIRLNSLVMGHNHVLIRLLMCTNSAGNDRGHPSCRSLPGLFTARHDPLLIDFHLKVLLGLFGGACITSGAVDRMQIRIDLGSRLLLSNILNIIVSLVKIDRALRWHLLVLILGVVLLASQFYILMQVL